MALALTTEQILALAPDAASAKNGQKLAVERSWVSRGSSEHALWGECQGSGKHPYQVQIDLSEGNMAYRCSCPSRKQPCKHVLGLMLLRASQPGLFATEVDMPAWASDWLERRKQSARKREAKQQAPSSAVADPETQAKRAAAREARIAAGFEELERWLSDLVRQGLAQVQSRGNVWEQQAARMVDAQAPGVARLLRNLNGIEGSGEGWQGRLLEHLGKLHLLIEGYKRLDQLPTETRDTIRSTLGIALKEEEVLTRPGLHDRWLVLGSSVEAEDNLRTRRTWLWGQEHHRPALVLHFAFGTQPLPDGLVAGTLLDAEVVFYPGAAPLRALVKPSTTPPAPMEPTTGFGYPDIATATGAYAAALARNPWMERFPMALQEVTLVCYNSNGGWGVRDREQRTLTFAPHFAQSWHILALSRGHPLALAGEWDGQYLTPISVWTEGRLTPLM
jgi:hypothetical protein